LRILDRIKVGDEPFSNIQISVQGYQGRVCLWLHQKGQRRQALQNLLLGYGNPAPIAMLSNFEVSNCVLVLKVMGERDHPVAGKISGDMGGAAINYLPWTARFGIENP
jgi:hypothetical protein